MHNYTFLVLNQPCESMASMPCMLLDIYRWVIIACRFTWICTRTCAHSPVIAAVEHLHSLATYRSTWLYTRVSDLTSVRSAHARSRTFQRWGAMSPPSTSETLVTAVTGATVASCTCRRRGRTACSMTTSNRSTATRAAGRSHTDVAGCDTSAHTSTALSRSVATERKWYWSLENTSSTSLSSRQRLDTLNWMLSTDYWQETTLAIHW